MGLVKEISEALVCLVNQYDRRLDDIDHRLDCLSDRMFDIEKASEPNSEDQSKWPPYKGHTALADTSLLGKRVKIIDGSDAVAFDELNGRFYSPHIAYDGSPEYRTNWEVVAEHCRLPTANDIHQSDTYKLDEKPFNNIILCSDDGQIIFSQARFVKVV